MNGPFSSNQAFRNRSQCAADLAMRAAIRFLNVSRRIPPPLDEVERTPFMPSRFELLELIVGEALVDKRDTLGSCRSTSRSA